MVIDAEFEEIEDDGSDAESELDLTGADSLPWLEADEEDEDAGGVDTAQIFAFGAILLAVLLGVVGAIYMLTKSTTDPALVADGSTIEAPEGPIKERPEDPGGKEFAGTGNVAPAVGEGQTREAQIDSGDSTTSAPTASETATGTAASEPPAPPATGGAYVQLAAYGTRDRAEKGWNDLSRQTGALSGKRYRVVEAVVGGATVYRLQVVAGNRSEATQLCQAIKADGLDCAVK
ncbi:SPOR domain-containing protein [Erythrobacter sp. GH1-10]|uniref:SPOR domain-containing protein n=1 Tax=Erythrobacter sp. GH1-10 TaxID=3349334 RepID=UPI003877F386